MPAAQTESRCAGFRVRSQRRCYPASSARRNGPHGAARRGAGHRSPRLRIEQMRYSGDDQLLPRALLYAVAEVARMLRDDEQTETAWAVETAWLGVLVA